MEYIKLISLFLIGVTAFSSVVMAFIDKHSLVPKEKNSRKINRGN